MSLTPFVADYMLLVDAHCHINLTKNPKEAISSALENGVAAIICSGDSLKDSEECIELADGKRIFATIGVGPDFACKETNYVEWLKEKIKENKGKVVGIGEIGLDAKVECNVKKQEEVFRDQIKLAKEFGMPIVVHSRQMINRVIEILKEEKAEKAMLHFFEGDEKQASELASRGYFLSFPPLESSRRNRIIKMLSLSNIVTETDSPFAGKEPSDVLKAVEIIARIKGVSMESAADAITQNIRNLFNINIVQGP